MKLWALLFPFALAADYYSILGLDKSASTRDIKKAYRQLSRQYHPDKNNGNEEAAQKFLEIGTAYEILSDENQRARYDKFGEAGINNGQQHSDPFDIFSHFFGGMGHGFQNQGRPKGQDTIGMLDISLQQSYMGETIEFTVNLQGICDECDGSGSADGKTVTCDNCKGSGQIITQHQLGFGMVQRIQVPCDKCNGKGQTIKNPCGVCHGTKVIREDRKYNVFLPEGAPRQWDYILEGEGNQSPDFDPGNLVIRLSESPDGNLGYRRRGQDLFRTEALSAKQASTGGWTRSILRLDGDSRITLKRDLGVQVVSNQIEKIEGEGMPGNQDHNAGNLYIEWVVVPSAGVSASAGVGANVGRDEL